MKIEFSKHFFNALIYDICNWGLNGVMIAFLWSQNHSYCTAIVGLFILRFVADFMCRRDIFAEQIAQRDQLLKQLANPPQQLEQEEFFEQLEFPDDVISPDKKDEDKKVH